MAGRLIINFVELWPKTKRIRILSPFSTSDKRDHTILYIPIPRHAEVYQIEQLLYKLPSHLKRTAEAIILRVHEPEARKIAAARSLIIPPLDSRFRGISIGMLRWMDQKHVLINLSGGQFNFFNISNDNIIKTVRHSELYSLIQMPGVQLPEMSNFHYVGPNKQHYSSFLRVGSALQSIDSLDSVCFWLLSFLKHKQLVVLDSWTILSLGLNISRYIEDCQIAVLEKNEMLVECLKRYDEDREETILRISNLIKERYIPSSLLLIVSARGRGKTLKKLLEISSVFHFKDIYSITLYASDERDLELNEERFCHIGKTFEPVDAKTCKFCSNGSTGVNIQPATYFLEISAAVESTSLTRSSVKQASEFFEKYAGLHIFSVHHNQHDGGRHHMIHADIKPFLESPYFKKKLEIILEKIKNEFNVVLAPNHERALLFGKVIAEKLNLPIIGSDAEELKFLNDDQAKILNESNNILIVDDVVITGGRLQGYRRFLLDAGFVNEKTKIGFFVALSRPDNFETLKGIKDMLNDPENFYSVEELLLPDWREDECPWCWELKRIKELGEGGYTRGVMKKRFQMLQENSIGMKGNGIENNLFLQWSKDKNEKLRLGPRSIFGPLNLTEAELFTSVASGLQRLRCDGKLDEQFGPPVAKVLRPPLYAQGRFYDNIIKASVFRAARIHDLRSTKTDRSLKKTITEMVKKKAGITLKAEIIFAIAQGKLPELSIDYSDLIKNGEKGTTIFMNFLVLKKII